MRSRPGIRWGSIQCFPDPLAGFKGPLCGGEGMEGREESRGVVREWKGKEVGTGTPIG